MRFPAGMKNVRGVDLQTQIVRKPAHDAPEAGDLEFAMHTFGRASHGYCADCLARRFLSDPKTDRVCYPLAGGSNLFYQHHKRVHA
jgi:hypothetical protein